MNLQAKVDQLFHSAEQGDWATFRSAFADDAVFKQNVGPEMAIDDAMPLFPRHMADGTTLAYENRRLLIGNNSVTEMHDAVFRKPDGKEIRLDICVVMQFDEMGKIVRADEYVDSAAARALFE